MRKIGHRLKDIQMGMDFFENVDDEKSGTGYMSGSKPIFCNKESNVYDNTLNCIMTIIMVFTINAFRKYIYIER